MKLAAWARPVGVHPKMAYRWFHCGTLPVPASQLETGTVLVTFPAAQPGGTVAFTRGCPRTTNAPIWTARSPASPPGLADTGTRCLGPRPVGSGLHGRRCRLMRRRADPAISTIIVAHRDRLACFGAESGEAALAASGRRVVIAAPGETTADLVRDRVDVLASCCARLYGRRAARIRALRAVTAAKAPARPRRFP